MIKTVIGNNVSRQTVILNGDTTVAEALAEGGIGTNGTITVNGATFRGNFDTPIAELAENGKLYLLQVAKADNA